MEREVRDSKGPAVSKEAGGLHALKVREVTARVGLTASRLRGYDYALNPYRGCQHSCVYCYSPAVLREAREWGSFVDVKVNLPRVLLKEVRKRRRGVVGISTVTDAYQPIERRYRLTRSCLKQLLRRDFPIVIQTKSALVLRDMDIIKKFSEKEVGFTITTFDDDLAKEYEPLASGIGARLEALERIAHNGISTWVFLGPIMPYLTDRGDGLERLISRLADIGVEEVIVDRLNYRKGVRERVMRFLDKRHPEFVKRYRNLPETYFEKVMERISRNCRREGLRFVKAW
jgi:DNA repair photolyase